MKVERTGRLGAKWWELVPVVKAFLYPKHQLFGKPECQGRANDREPLAPRRILIPGWRLFKNANNAKRDQTPSVPSRYLLKYVGFKGGIGSKAAQSNVSLKK